MDGVTGSSPRHHADRCPGVLRPWIADDGALVRLRLIGGALSAQALADLALIAGEHADGHLYLTKRANIQLRGIKHDDGRLSDEFVDAVKAAGLLPSLSHELVRNIMVSPLSGRIGGQADLRPVANHLDVLLCDDPVLANLAGRFLFVLDDGRGDLVDRTLDLGVMAVDAGAAQIRVGTEHWGGVVELDDVPEVLLDLARRFLDVNGDGDDALWHVAELPDGGADLLGLNHARDLRTQVASLPAPYGVIAQDDGLSVEHVAIPDGDLTHDLATQVLARAGGDVIVTPWRSLLLPDLGGGAGPGVAEDTGDADA
jgi:precorrin-3B synthase